MKKNYLLHGIQMRATIELNTLIERRVGGRIEHTFTMASLDDQHPYSKVFTLNGREPLKGCIERIEDEAEKWARVAKYHAGDVRELEALGFKVE